MEIEYDPDKRQRTLLERGLELADAGDVFASRHVTFEDRRKDYGEARWVTLGTLAGRMVFVAWTGRGRSIRIISMRKANEREQKRYGPRLGH